MSPFYFIPTRLVTAEGRCSGLCSRGKEASYASSGLKSRHVSLAATEFIDAVLLQQSDTDEDDALPRRERPLRNVGREAFCYTTHMLNRIGSTATATPSTAAATPATTVAANAAGGNTVTFQVALSADDVKGAPR